MAEPFASVLIPTHNPGPGIAAVLSVVLDQEVDFPIEVVIVDSESRSGDLQLMRKFPVRLHSIPKAEFGHGRTRNLLAHLSKGQLLLYLSQDACPVSTTCTLVRSDFTPRDRAPKALMSPTRFTGRVYSRESSVMSPLRRGRLPPDVALRAVPEFPGEAPAVLPPEWLQGFKS